MKHAKRWLVLFFACLLLLAVPVRASANSAEPPTLTILVNNAPSNLLVELRLPDGTKENPLTLKRSDKEGRGWETYYRFFLYRPYGFTDDLDDYGEVLVTNGTESFSIPLPKDAIVSQAGSYRGHTPLFTLDLSARTLTPDVPAWRGPLLVFLRVALTLLIEGAIFYWFGYREKRSWIVFFVVNLITQGLLNLYLTGMFHMQTSSYVSPILIIVGFFEVLIFIAEALVYDWLLKEEGFSKGRGVLYAFVANLASYVLGGALIMFLPL